MLTEPWRLQCSHLLETLGCGWTLMVTRELQALLHKKVLSFIIYFRVLGRVSAVADYVGLFLL